jgi:hypothetical protein
MIEKKVQLYCFKCKKKQNAVEVKQITMKNGRPATQGLCESCGTKMFRIGALKKE